MKKLPIPFFAFLLLFAIEPLVAQPNASDAVTLQMPNNPVAEVAGFYETLTNKRLILDSGLAGPNLSISVNQTVTRQEAIALIEAALILNGYTMIPVDDRTSKLLGPTKQARSESIPLYTDVSQLPEGEGIVSFFMPFRYIKIDEAQAVFNSYVVVRPFGGVVAVPSVNALVITENIPLVRRMIGLKQLIDVQGGRTATEFVELQRADAERVAEILNSLFSGESEQISAPAGSPAALEANPAMPGDAPAQVPAPAPGVATASVGQKVQILADPRTNRIMIVAPEGRMAYVKGLIANLDVAVSFDDPLEKQLRFASAGDLLPVIGNLLAEGDEEVETTGGTGSGGAAATTGRGPGSNAGDTGTTGAAGSGSKPDRLNAPTQETAPESISVGKVRIIADRSSNKIIVIGPPESRAKASRVIDMMDQRPKQVYLAVVIGQLTLGDGIEAGIDYLIRTGDVRVLGQGSSASIANLLSNRNAGIDLLPGASDAINVAGEAANQIAGAALPIASGLTVFGTIGDSVDIFARALASTNRFQIISRPVVYAANNQKAVISSGQQVPVPQSTLTSVVNGGLNNNNSNAVTSNIEYKDVVLKLEVIPLINSKDEVTLTIAQQNDNIQELVEISNNQVPVIGTQELTTTVTVPNRHTIILGGLITDQEQRVETGIPFLKDIPLLGYAFATTKKDTVRRELIVMIQPFIIDSDETLQQANFIERSNSSFRDGIYEDVAPLAPGNVPTVPSFGPSPEKPFGEVTW